jgi:hypothetical protein
MAEMIIQLRRDPQTGKQTVTIKLHSDPDALPHEHEQMHRELVEKLINKGLVSAEELENVVIEREQPQGTPQAPQGTEHPQRQKAAEGR